MSPQQLTVSFGCTPFRVTSDLEDGQTPVEAIKEAVADLEDIEPRELPPLAEWIDPDVVNRLFEQDQSQREATAALCFTYAEWNVFVRSDGTFIIGDPDMKTGPTPLF